MEHEFTQTDRQFMKFVPICSPAAVLFTFRQPLYMFLESVGMGEVCIDKVNPATQTIRIMISGGECWVSGGERWVSHDQWR